MKTVRLITVLFLLCVSLSGLAGGGWTHAKGKGFFKLSQNMIIADQYFTKDGKLSDLGQGINYYSSSIYGEYGFTDRITGILYAPFFVRSTINQLTRGGTVVDEGDEMNAIGDFDLSVKYALIKDGPIVLSASLTFGLPFGETAGGEGMILQSGDGEFNQLLKVEASHSFYPKPFYVSAMVGFNNRTEGFSDEFHAGFEAGVTLNKFTGILKVYNVTSFFNGEATPSQGNGIYSNNLEYFSYSPELLYNITGQLGVAASAGFAFSGRHILAAPNLGVGVYWEL